VCCVIDEDVIIKSLNFPGVERDSGILTLTPPPSDPRNLTSSLRKRSNMQQ
jgi:hypothetical protein